MRQTSDGPLMKSSVTSCTPHHSAKFMFLCFRSFNLLLIQSLNPLLLCASCLLFAPLCVPYLQLLSANSIFDNTQSSFVCADFAGSSSIRHSWSPYELHSTMGPSTPRNFTKIKTRMLTTSNWPTELLCFPGV